MTSRSDRRSGAATALAIALVATLGTAACTPDQKMARQPSYRPLEASDFFEDGRASRPLVEGTVARGHLQDDEVTATGRSGAEFSRALPVPVTRALLDRGRQRYDIYCAPCHDRVGDGGGMAVLRGFPKPPSLHIDRLREVRPGYLFDVITRGFGRMPSYASQVPAADRWAVVAYVRALQLSQNAPAAGLSDEERARVEAGGEAR